MSEDILVQHCSPTLIGLKTGNMFTYRFKSDDDKKENIRRLNRTLGIKGIRVIPLRENDNHRTLLYVFRPSKLNKDLKNTHARTILEKMGYDCNGTGKCIAELVKRLKFSDSFPHEVGLFLGYPPEDVSGFISQSGNCKCCGCWKVYGDENKAKRTFEKYKKCTELCCSLVEKGCSVEQITASC